MSDENRKIINHIIDTLTGPRKANEKFLSNINELQKTQLNLFQHEIQRLSNTSDSNDSEPDPRIKILEEHIVGIKQAIKGTTIQLEIGRIIVPNVKEGEILVHGRITNEEGHGIENVIVSPLVDGKALDVKGKSDSSGYYSIVLPTQIVESIKGKDINLYFYLRKELIHMSQQPIKLTGREVKYEAVYDKSELKNVYAQEKVKKIVGKIRKSR